MIKKLYDHIRMVEDIKEIKEWIGVQAPQMTTQQKLAYPDPRPCNFDNSLEFWLERISKWGRLHFYHIDPEFHGKRKMEIPRSVFVKKIKDARLNKMFGLWDVELLAINKVKIFREYNGLDGRRYVEEFIVEIDLKPELKKALKR